MILHDNLNNSEILRTGGAFTAAASLVVGSLGLFLIPAGLISGLNLLFSASLFIVGVIIFSIGHVMLHRKKTN